MRAVTSELGCDVVMRRSYLVLGALFVGAVAAAFFTVALAFAFAAATAFWFFAMLTWPIRVTVGEDGLYAWYGLQRYYVPIAMVRSARVWHGTAQVVLTSGRVLTFHGETSEAKLFEAAVHSAMAAHDASAVPEAAFRRGDRTFEAWSRDAKALVRDARSSYRVATVPREIAIKHVQNASLPGEVRVGAALALGEGTTKEERDAIATTIEGAASPMLRLALEHASAGRLTEAERAHTSLEQLEREEAIATQDQRAQNAADR